ncbi:fibronectin type III domain-containing protein [Luteitalea sp.]|uniref:fibronectin type III domain-containing protein n=1 Tax=Luteitalea sp. TaxID=2004800 RepID=UPI0025C4C680|nr:fibronectin type III domain-containing protein [Luteitalea sp.]
MQTFRLIAIVLLALLSLPLVAHGQTPIVLAPGAGVTVTWDAPSSGAAGAPTGYRFETFRETETGVVVTTTDVPATSMTATLPGTVLPADGPFLLAVRAFNAQGVSDRSNALPFVRAMPPGAPTNLRIAP